MLALDFVDGTILYKLYLYCIALYYDSSIIHSNQPLNIDIVS